MTTDRTQSLVNVRTLGHPLRLDALGVLGEKRARSFPSEGRHGPEPSRPDRISR
jgi:hypothetical protein